MPYGGGYSGLSSEINKLNRYNFIKNSRKGAILIEFAFAVPVLFSLIYYVHDLHHLKQMQERMKFVAMEIASILQNISQDRENKEITAMDIKHAVATAYLSFFPGKTFYNTSRMTSPLGYSSYGYIYCVKGQAGEKASVVWSKRWYAADETYAPSSVTILNRDARSIINQGSNISPPTIYKDLKISEGEMKIIVEVAMHSGGDRYRLPNGKTVAQSGGISKLLGFYLYPYKATFKDGYGACIFFNSVIIFTPKPGLFSETPPQ